MKLMNQKVTLSLVIGKTWLSKWETSRLAVGDIIRTPSVCGRPYSLTLNDRYLCRGEIVVLGGRFGTRLTGFDGEPQGPDRPAVEEIFELLPAEVRLTACQAYAMQELDGLISGAIVEFEEPYREDEDADLVVCGVTLARGKVVSLGETFGLKLTRVHGAHATQEPPRISFNRVEAAAAGALVVKPYNWKRPDKFTRGAITRIRRTHELFLENAPFFHPVFAGWRVAAIDQCAFYEEKGRLAALGHLAVIRAPRAAGPSRGSFASVQNPKVQVQPVGSPNPPLPPAFVEYLKGKGSNPSSFEAQAVLLACQKDSAVAEALKGTPHEAILQPLRNGWKHVVAMDFVVDRVVNEMAQAEIVPDNDMVISVTLGGPGGEEVILIYPYIMLEPYLPYLE